MSSSVEERECPRCEGKLEFGRGSLPPDNYEYCYDCGYCCIFVIGQLTLEEVNEMRVNCESNIKVLKQLKVPTWGSEAEHTYQSDIAKKNET